MGCVRGSNLFLYTETEPVATSMNEEVLVSGITMVGNLSSNGSNLLVTRGVVFRSRILAFHS